MSFSIAYKSSSFDEVEVAAVKSTDWEIGRDRRSGWKGIAAEAKWILQSFWLGLYSNRGRTVTSVAKLACCAIFVRMMLFISKGRSDRASYPGRSFFVSIAQLSRTERGKESGQPKQQETNGLTQGTESPSSRDDLPWRYHWNRIIPGQRRCY